MTLDLTPFERQTLAYLLHSVSISFVVHNDDFELHLREGFSAEERQALESVRQKMQASLANLQSHSGNISTS